MIPVLSHHDVFTEIKGSYHFGTEDGLPSNHVLCMYVDREGAVWVGTSGGAARYDGYEFKIYDESSGLPQNEVLKILEDVDGSIWLQTFNHLVRLRANHDPEDMDLPFRDSDPPLPRMVKCEDQIRVFNMIKSGGTWAYSDGKWNRLSKPGTGRGNDFSRSIWRSGNIWWGLSQSGIVSLTGPEQIISSEWELLLELQPLTIDPVGSLLFTRFGQYIFNGESISKIKLLDENGEPLRQPLAALIDSNRNLWVSVSGKGLYRYSTSSFSEPMVPVETCFKREEITWLDEDKQGNIWLGTARSGLLMLPETSFQMSVWGQEDGLAGKSIESIGLRGKDELLLAHENNQVSKMIHGEVVWTSRVATECRKCRLRELLSVDENCFLSLSHEGVFRLGKEEHWTPVYKGAMKTMSDYGDSVLISNHKGVFVVPQPDLGFQGILGTKGRKIFDQRAYALLLQGNKLWIGTNRGLVTRNLDGNKGQLEAVILDKVSVTDIEIDKEDRLWVATNGKGTIIIDGEKRTHFTTETGLSSNYCKQIAIDKTGAAWIATQKGINFVYQDNATGMPVVEMIDRRNGLPSEEILSLKIVGDSIFAGTTQGLVAIPLAYFTEKELKVPEVKIDSVLIQGNSIRLEKELQLTHDKNEVRIRFSTVFPMALGSLEFRFRMLGLGAEDWTVSTSREAYFRSLPTGNYSFEVQARIAGRQWGETDSLRITLSPPFTQTMTFWLTLAAFLGLLLVLLYRWRVWYIRREANKKRQLVELRLQVLRSQMRPHFIFNALAAIQQFIPENAGIEAHNYLSNFAGLMRRVLEDSRSNFVALGEEIKTIELYIKVEELRFKNLFAYHIQVEEGLLAKTPLIPPMLIQPFVENAIQHGLRHKKTKGKLQISFNKLGEYLICEVRDDGIGRTASATLQRQKLGPTSRGTQIVEEQMSSLTELIHTRANIEIEDLIDDFGSPSGTRVTIRFPYLDNY